MSGGIGHTIFDIAAAGLGVAIQPLSVSEIRSAGLVCVPNADADGKAELGLAYHSDAENPLVSSVVSMLRGK